METTNTQADVEALIREMHRTGGDLVLRLTPTERIDLEYPKGMFPDGPGSCCSGYMCGCMGKPTDPPLAYGLSGVIVEGGETSKMHPAWLRRIRDDCDAVSVPFTFLGWGGWVPVTKDPQRGDRWLNTRGDDLGMWIPGDGITWYLGAAVMRPVGSENSGRLLDGVTHDAFPE